MDLLMKHKKRRSFEKNILKPKEFGTVAADSQVFVAGIVAGSLLELIRSAYLYPLSTIKKTRIQNIRGRRRRVSQHE